MPFWILDLPDETLESIISKCCTLQILLVKTPERHFTTTLHPPRCHILSTNKRLRGLGNIEQIREEVLDQFFWSRVRFLSNSWFAILRAVVNGPPDAATQQHTLEKDNMAMEIDAHTACTAVAGGRIQRCNLFLRLTIRGTVNGGLSSTGMLVDIDLPTAYLTPPDKRKKRQKDRMRDWQSDRSADLSKKFDLLHKDFARTGKSMFVDM
jgi:hypothetical protein